MIIFIVFSQQNVETIENKTDERELETRDKRNTLIEIERYMENYVSYALESSLLEMGKYGGYIGESVPSPNFYGVPYRYYAGNIVNIPSQELMKQLLFQRTQRKIQEQIFQLERDRPEYSIRLNDFDFEMSRFSVKLTVAYTFSFEEKKYPLESTRHVSMRLMEMHDLANEFGRYYLKKRANSRAVEHILMQVLFSNDKIPAPPSGVSKISNCTPYNITLENLRPQLIDSAMYATMSFKTDIFNDFNGSQYLWTFKIAQDAVNITLGPHKDVIAFDPLYNPQINQCWTQYKAQYKIAIPIEITITDTISSYSLKGKYNVNEHLIYRFYIMAYLDTDNIDAGLNSNANTYVDDVCGGECIIHLSGELNEVGSLYLQENDCAIDHTKEKHTNVLCGQQTIVALPQNPQKSLFYRKLSLKPHKVNDINIEFSNKISYSGSVVVNDAVLCSDGIVKRGSDISLNYIDGDPPRYINIVLYPFNTLFNPYVAVTDEDGDFSFENIEPGKYLLFVYSSKSPDGRSGWKVRNKSDVIDLYEDVNEKIELRPALFVKTPSGDAKHYYRTGDC